MMPIHGPIRSAPPRHHVLHRRPGDLAKQANTEPVEKPAQLRRERHQPPARHEGAQSNGGRVRRGGSVQEGLRGHLVPGIRQDGRRQAPGPAADGAKDAGAVDGPPEPVDFVFPISRASAGKLVRACARFSHSTDRTPS